VGKKQQYVTEMDLRHSLIPDHMVEELIKTMPVHRGPMEDEDREYEGYDYVSYMQKVTGLGSSEVNGNGSG